MKFYTPFLLASSVFAAPNKHQSSRHRRALTHGFTNNTITSGDYTAGAVLIGTGYTSVTAEFTVPSIPASSEGSAFVAIDGYTCNEASLQAGIEWDRVAGGTLTYSAWYEWFPDYAYDFSISLQPGSSLKVTVTATSKTSGTAVIENFTTGQTVTHTFTNEASIGDLCEFNAGWYVEDVAGNFGTIAFTDASATHNGAVVGVTGATILDSNPVTCVLIGTSEVSCSYG